MNPNLEHAMQSFAAAVAARRLYFAAHPSVSANISKAHESLVAALASRSEVIVHMLADRVLGPDGTFACSADLRDAVFVPLARRGFNSVAFACGVTEPDLRTCIDVLAEPESEIAVLPATIRFGTSTVSTRDTLARTEPHRLADLVSKYRQVWKPVTAEAATRASELEGVAAAVCASVETARGTMIELGGLKTYDEYTYVHTVNVALLSAALAEACGLRPEHVHRITLAALMHDIGKRVVPLQILAKNGPLDDNERAVMSRHPVEGARILMAQPGVPQTAIVVAFEHHMHLDGTGYPARPKSWSPNLAAQIVQQADVFDALRTHRPYRAAMLTEKACGILQEGAGTKYDASLVETFIRQVANRAPAPEVPAAQAVAA